MLVNFEVEYSVYHKNSNQINSALLFQEIATHVYITVMY